MKEYTFICYDKYPKTTKKFHIFKKRFSSLAGVAKFLKVSNKIYLYYPMNEFSKDELHILAIQFKKIIVEQIKISTIRANDGIGRHSSLRSCRRKT